MWSNFLCPVVIKVIDDADHISFLVVVETDISWRDVAMSEPTDTKERVRSWVESTMSWCIYVIEYECTAYPG